MVQTVLVAGATGMFGSRVADKLLERPNTKVRLLVRSAEKNGKRDFIQQLVSRGADVVTGDIADAASLDRATRGVDVIVSTLQGGPDVIVDGQMSLANIGKKNGVRRILPSDYALDLFNATPGEHMMFDVRRQADEAISTTGIEHVHVLQGAFMELFGPGMGTIDYDNGTVTFWGDGTQVIDCTSVESTAAMVAHVALDPSVASGKFAFAGDRISILDAAKVIEEQMRRPLERRSNGSEEQLRAARSEAARNNPQMAVNLAYQLYMLNGQTTLTNLQNDRYSDLRPESFRNFAARALPHDTSSMHS